MLSNAYFLAKFRFDTDENEPAKILQNFVKFANFADPVAHRNHQAASDLESLAGVAADLHKACDFTLKNFDIRQEARGQEIEALQQALAILSGMQ